MFFYYVTYIDEIGIWKHKIISQEKPPFRPIAVMGEAFQNKKPLPIIVYVCELDEQQANILKPLIEYEEGKNK